MKNRAYEEQLQQEIIAHKKKRGTLLLGHYYLPAAVQDVCDYVGDSLGLSRKAAETDAKEILFCGVHFMAETASILSPNRRVLLPALEAGCSLAESITVPQIEAWRKANPEGVVISYVNTTAEVKAVTDCCCTSANAVKVVESYRNAPSILFLPDANLGRYVQHLTGIKMEIWDGACHVHSFITRELIHTLMAEYPQAEVLLHPESSCSWQMGIVNNPRVFIGSTTGMVKRVQSATAKQFIVATELGVMHQMRKVAPEKELIPVRNNSICGYMKYNTLERVATCLRTGAPEVKVSEELRIKAERSIRKMIEIG